MFFDCDKAIRCGWGCLFSIGLILAALASVHIFASANSYAGSVFSKGHREALKRGCETLVQRGIYRNIAKCRRMERQKIVSQRELVSLNELTKSQKDRFQMSCLKSMSRGIFAYDDCLNATLVKLGLREATLEPKQLLPREEKTATLPKPTIPMTGGAAQKLSTPVLVKMLEKGTVLILTNGGMGSGFFIAPDLIVTNRHVIEGTQGRAYFTSRAIGSVHTATIMARSTKPGTPGQRDFALLMVDKYLDRKFFFPVNLAPVKLGSVIASGYPGLIIGNDESFSRLRNGDASAAPDLVLSRGEISANQTSENGVSTLAHTAQIMQGNSGGPLLDACGRVVGINTFISVNVNKGGKAGFALSSQELLKFLDSHAVKAKVDKRTCGN
jgi:hypothetical protein